MKCIAEPIALGRAHRPVVASLLFMRSVEEASFAEQRAEGVGSCFCRANLPHDHGGPVLHPVDGTVGLSHRRTQTAASHIVELLGLPTAGSELTHFTCATTSMTPRKAASLT